MRLEEIFSVKNEYSQSKCYKIFTLCGLKIKIKNKKKTKELLNKNAATSSIKPNYTYTASHYALAMLKAYGIRNIVTSPGTQNAAFNIIAQQDSYFRCFSVVDERSAVYVASGIVNETGEPVVITCTGATASRNYLSGLTEAFYRKLPIIALTFYNYSNNPYSVTPQYVDRRISQNDIKTIDVELPKIVDQADKTRALVFLNAALSTAKYKNEPVHINCPSILDFRILDEIKTLPEDIWTTKYIYDDFGKLKNELAGKKVGLFIGSHNKFEDETLKCISEFAKSNNIPVFCDHTSNYTGKNKVLISQAMFISKIKNKPEIIIDLGEICGDYTHFGLISNAKIWRINEDENFKCRCNYPVQYSLMCKEQVFFKEMSKNIFSTYPYYNEIKKEVKVAILPDEMPLSHPLVTEALSRKIPNNSSLHVSILSGLRSSNFFNFDNSIDITCNVGGFGIDGAVSTIVGQSFNNYNKKCFGLIGDLAFFYDMNALGNRDIKNNLRIICVNNNRGEEFSLSAMYARVLDKNSEHMAAAGHFKNGAQGWAESCGFEYMSAKTKEEFYSKIDDFCNKDCDKPMFFEVFTTNEDEMKAYNIMKNL